MKKNELPAKEAIIEYYIKGLHTVQECADYFNIGKTKFYRCLKLYGISRSPQDKSAVYSRIQNTESVRAKITQANLQKYGAVNKPQADRCVHFYSDNSFSVNGVSYTYDWLYEEYCVKNTPLKQMCTKLGVSTTVFYQVCHYYNIKKTTRQRYENIQKTVCERYNVLSTFQLPEVQRKGQESMMHKYGVDSPTRSPEIREQIRQTCLKKYGVSNFTQTQDYQERARNTSLRKYGSPHHQQRDIKHLDIWNNKQRLEQYLQSLSSPVTAYDLMLYFNLTDRTVVYAKIHEWQLDKYVTFKPPKSHYENDIVNWLKNEYNIDNIVSNKRDLLSGQEIDIYLPDYKLGIEFNGDYWHSDIYYQDHGGRSLYHQNKSLVAEKRDIFIFHIFEHEWVDEQVQSNIKNRLSCLLHKNTQKIPARKCTVIELTTKQKKEFLNQNHIQGNDHSTKNIGLMYQGELVACMTFVRPKNKKYTWELSRFCSKRGYNIQGGASKMFKYFIRDLEAGNTVSSYNDITKTRGDIYKILGFTCVSINRPNYIWINFQTGDIRTRYQEQAAGEVARMHSKGYHRVCDCGTKTWVYTKT